MITRLSRCLVTLVMLGAVSSTACEKVPLLAPSGSTIVLTAASNVVGANGALEVMAQVLEPAGTPPHSGTHVLFTTTLGVIEPAEATTDINGRARAMFKPNGANGTASITASSGGATTGANGVLRLAVGTAAVGRIVVNASPASIPAGGRSTITASVLDLNGSALGNVAVSFSADAGTLSTTLANTDANGVAISEIITSQTATVRATVGTGAGSSTGTPTTPTNPTTPTTPTTPSTTQSFGEARVTVIPATTVTIEHPATPPSAGIPATFRFVVTIPQGGNPLRDLRVSWGDGSGTQSFGAVSGTQSAAHVYDEAGTFMITATAVDATGVSQSIATSVTVIPIPRPTIVVTPTPQTQTVGGTINFNIQITSPQGVGIQNTTIDFGDGQTQSLGGATAAVVPHQYTTTGTKLVRVTVLDTAGQTTEGTTSVSITP